MATMKTEAALSDWERVSTHANARAAITALQEALEDAERDNTKLKDWLVSEAVKISRLKRRQSAHRRTIRDMQRAITARNALIARLEAKVKEGEDGTKQAN